MRNFLRARVTASSVALVVDQDVKDADKPEPVAKIIEVERQAVGRPKLSLFTTYCRYCGGLWFGAMLVAATVGWQALTVAQGFALKVHETLPERRGWVFFCFLFSSTVIVCLGGHCHCPSEQNRPCVLCALLENAPAYCPEMYDYCPISFIVLVVHRIVPELSSRSVLELSIA